MKVSKEVKRFLEINERKSISNKKAWIARKNRLEYKK